MSKRMNTADEMCVCVCTSEALDRCFFEGGLGCKYVSCLRAFRLSMLYPPLLATSQPLMTHAVSCKTQMTTRHTILSGCRSHLHYPVAAEPKLLQAPE